MRSTKLLLPAAFRGLKGHDQSGSQGFNERADIMATAGDGTSLADMYREVNETLAMYNQYRNRLMDRLVYRVTRTVETVGVPTYANFEKASEYGQPVGHRGVSRRHRGYTFGFYDLAERYTWMWLAEATRDDLTMLHNQAMEADNRLIFNEVMRTLLNPTNLVGVADSNIPVNVYKLYNADGEVPPQWKSYTFDGTHSHYLVSGGAAVVSGDLDDMAEQLIHHGHDPIEGAELVALVNKAQADVIKTFRVASGASYDFMPSANYGGGVYLPSNGGVIGAPQGNVPEEFGTYGPWHLVREDQIPAGYMVGLASGGPNNAGNPVGIREHENPAYRGLKIIPGQRSDYPLMDAFYRRGFGVGMRQRGAAVVMQVKASGTYDIPAGFTY